MAVSATSALSEPAYAADGDPLETIANPANTTIDVFDYWVYDNGGNSNAQGTFYTGINEGHTLLFRHSGGSNIASYNIFTGFGGGAVQGIVANNLGSDGYPVLTVGGGESLAYLFNGEDLYDGNNRIAKKRLYRY